MVRLDPHSSYGQNDASRPQEPVSGTTTALRNADSSPGLARRCPQLRSMMGLPNNLEIRPSFVGLDGHSAGRG
jgi:hypothetical protein